MLSLEAQVLPRLRRNSDALFGHCVLGRNHQLWLVFDAMVSDRGHGLRQLQHGKCRLTLPYAQRMVSPAYHFCCSGFCSTCASSLG